MDPAWLINMTLNQQKYMRSQALRLQAEPTHHFNVYTTKQEIEAWHAHHPNEPSAWAFDGLMFEPDKDFKPPVSGQHLSKDEILELFPKFCYLSDRALSILLAFDLPTRERGMFFPGDCNSNGLPHTQRRNVGMPAITIHHRVVKITWELSKSSELKSCTLVGYSHLWARLPEGFKVVHCDQLLQRKFAEAKGAPLEAPHHVNFLPFSSEQIYDLIPRVLIIPTRPMRLSALLNSPVESAPAVGQPIEQQHISLNSTAVQQSGGHPSTNTLSARVPINSGSIASTLSTVRLQRDHFIMEVAEIVKHLSKVPEYHELVKSFVGRLQTSFPNLTDVVIGAATLSSLPSNSERWANMADLRDDEKVVESQATALTPEETSTEPLGPPPINTDDTPSRKDGSADIEMHGRSTLPVQVPKSPVVIDLT